MAPRKPRAELNSEDFFSLYLRSLPESEAPLMFHRWSAIVGIGAYIGRSAWFQHGDFKVFPNIYAMLIADAGVRKSTSIKQFVKVLKKAGYNNFAAQKTSKEQFLLDLEQASRASEGSLDYMTEQLFGQSEDIDESVSANMFAAPDEFNELFGNNILEFVSMLGTLWDFDGVFENRVKNSQSVRIPNPCISLLGGNTPSTLYNTFPPEVIGQGFFSRLLFIHSPSTNKKIAFPGKIEEEVYDALVDYMKEIKNCAHGEMHPTKEALEALIEIYETWPSFGDYRFSSYMNRRFTQLLKLCTIHSLADRSRKIELIHVIRATTVLTWAEKHMSAGLGEFGKSKNSDVAHKILTLIEHSTDVVSMKDIALHVAKDVQRTEEIISILQSFVMQERIQSVEGGYIINKQVHRTVKDCFLDPDYLSFQEREI